MNQTLLLQVLALRLMEDHLSLKRQGLVEGHQRVDCLFAADHDDSILGIHGFPLDEEERRETEVDFGLLKVGLESAKLDAYL